MCVGWDKTLDRKVTVGEEVVIGRWQYIRSNAGDLTPRFAVVVLTVSGQYCVVLSVYATVQYCNRGKHSRVSRLARFTETE